MRRAKVCIHNTTKLLSLSSPPPQIYNDRKTPIPTHTHTLGFHLNFYITPTFSSPPKGIPDTPLTESEKVGIQRGELWRKTGAAYSIEHGTRPSTIGLLLGASPLALLGWIGEKFLSWSDVPPSTEEILRSVTLYWFTESMGRGIYPYRSVSIYIYFPVSFA